MCVKNDVLAMYVFVTVSTGRRGEGRNRARCVHAFASAARSARVVCDIRGDWNCHARNYTQPQNVK